MSIDAVSGPVEDLLTQVSKVIEVIRPAIQADDGDIELHGVDEETGEVTVELSGACLLYTSPSPRDQRGSRMPSSA